MSRLAKVDPPAMLRSLLSQSGLTPEQFEERLDLKPNQFEKWLSGAKVRFVHVQRMRAFAKLHGYTFHWTRKQQSYEKPNVKTVQRGKNVPKYELQALCYAAIVHMAKQENVVFLPEEIAEMVISCLNSHYLQMGYQHCLALSA